MHGHGGPREDPLTDLGYEPRDINVHGLKVTAAIFFGFAAASALVVYVWFLWYKPQMNTTLDPRKPMPKIELQGNISVRADIAEFRQAETARLGTSGKNPDGTWHISIDQAMDQIAKQGLPHTLTATPAVSPGNTIKQNALPPGQHRTAADSALPGGGQ